MDKQFRVRFLPSDRAFPIEEDETLLDLAMKSGVHINASCGGNGTCGKCRIKILKGSAASARHPKVAEWEYESGVRLACMTRPLEDVEVEIPLESQVDRAVLRRTREGSHVLSAADIDQLVTGWEVDPAVFKRYLELPPPSMEDNLSDLGRLTRQLKRQHEINHVSVDFRVLTFLSRVLRDADWKVTVTLVLTRRGIKLINVEPGNREDRNFSIVIDIGTTTVCGQLLDLARCAIVLKVEQFNGGSHLCTVSEASDYNFQISYGEDVISRIMYAQKEGGLNRLQEVVIGTINGLIKELLALGGIDVGDVSHLVLAGNTTMTQLILGLDPRHIMLSPYVPTANFIPPARAAEVGIQVKEHVHAYIFPCVASYVGGDIVAGVLGSGMFQREEVTLFIDIGTNGEIVVGNKDWMTCASCSAGPAFEGGGIKFGMRAGRGAIEQVGINPSTYEPMVLTIGRAKPAGICGSGLIGLAAELFAVGLIDQNGRFVRDLATERVREGESGWEYVISFSAETAIGRDITLTEVDLDNLMRAKAALYAGCKVLLESVGLSFKDLDRVIIAGGFGHYLDIEKAITIGLLPDLPEEKFTFVGNGSLLGARLLSFSRDLLMEAERIARTMTNIELSTSITFMDEFIAAMFIPHTDMEAFPSVKVEPKTIKAGQ